MFDDIFEADFFDDDIVEEDVADDYDYDDVREEDVDMFDEDYFEASEGNPINKGKKKQWEYDKVTNYGGKTNAFTPENLKYVRNKNREHGNYNFIQYDNNHVRKGYNRYDYDRDTRIASNPGGGKRYYDLQDGTRYNKNAQYVKRYNAAKNRIDAINTRETERADIYNRSVPKKFRTTPNTVVTNYKNVAHEMNHPSKK